MPSVQIDYIKLENNSIIVSFDQSIAVNTLVNANFEVWTTAATPVQISSPFDTINIATDWNSISRTLTLDIRAGVLSPSTSYNLYIKNLKTPTLITLDTYTFPFTTPSNYSNEATNSTTTVGSPDTLVPEDVIDYSVLTGAYKNTSATSGTSTSFYVTGSDPGNGEFYLEEDYNNGVITIKFNQKPEPFKLVFPYLKVQRKLLSSTVTRWTTIVTKVSVDVNKPWVYIAFPSTDATPVYQTAGKTYFESDYIYRVILSHDLSADA